MESKENGHIDSDWGRCVLWFPKMRRTGGGGEERPRVTFVESVAAARIGWRKIYTPGATAGMLDAAVVAES